MKKLLMWAALSACSLSFADVYIIDGERVEGEVHEEDGMRTICTAEMCMILPDDAVKVEDEPPAEEAEGQPRAGVAYSAVGVADSADGAVGVADAADGAVGAADSPEGVGGVGPTPQVESRQRASRQWMKGGYMDKDTFLKFLRGEVYDETDDGGFLAGKAWYLVILLVLVGGLAMNLTPCVLPMMPINLMVIGKSASRGALYGLGIAVAYGTMGVLAAVGGLAFGTIQGSPWFNLAIALLFVALALSMFGVFMIDFSKARQGAFNPAKLQRFKAAFPFVMGMVSAVLAGACIAPILIAVLLLTAKLYAAGQKLALALPFVLGLGMALPWPFAGAGLKLLPKPGAWMGKVNKLFGVIVLLFAAWYGFLAYRGFTFKAEGEITPDNFSLVGVRRPVLVDCWATWCKNCKAMEETTLRDPEVKAELERRGFTVIRLQCEKGPEDLERKQPDFKGVKGLPTFVIFE